MVQESPFSCLNYPCLMGVVNVTPNSFSDGGAFLDAGAAVGRARELVRQGARVLDLGGEASSFFRAGVEAVSAGEQLRRLMPVLEGLGDLRDEVVISVDTRSAEVAAAVIGAGARVINDISAGMHEPELLKVVARAGVGMVLMHMSAGYPKTAERDDGDIVGAVKAGLLDRKRVAMAAGIEADRIALDPGIGFGKTMADNWRLAMGEWGDMGIVVLGVSRKRFLETVPPGDVVMPGECGELVRQLGEVEKAEARGDEARRHEAHEGARRGMGGDVGVHPRDVMTAAITAVAARRGVGIHRVHHVTLAARALAM